VNRSPSGPAGGRLVSLDAYRGFIMLAMLSGGFGFLEISHRFPSSSLWGFLATQFNHAPWEGCTFWDLIQPSFMFMVGVAIPFSYSRRREKGQSHARIYAHALVRAAILVALGLVGVLMLRRLVLFKAPWPVPIQTTHILVQIGVTYGLAFPLVRRRAATQLAVAVAILAAYYVAFLLYPAPEPGLFAHWNRSTNLGAAWDQWLVDLSPSDWLDHVHALGLTSLNFIPGVSTVLTGMLVGEFLRGPRSARTKTAWLARGGAACFVVGWLLGRTLCPMVKLIWTPSFAIYSSAWTLWFLAAFYWVIEVRGWRGWSLPLVVVGLNSIAVFVLYFTVDWWIWKGWTVVLGRGLFESVYGPLWSSLATLVVLWGTAAALYWRRIFIRL
jgi:heparan-alpha-glucosaminide N-acetyltransferase